MARAKRKNKKESRPKRYTVEGNDEQPRSDFETVKGAKD
jgi:hypothetical protein